MRNKGLIVILLAVFFTSCNLILKDKKDNIEVNTEFITNGGREVVGEADKHGCAISAGYRWSNLKKGCIRVFEEGFRLNPIEDQEDFFENELEDNDVSCFIVFSEDKKQAEIFLPTNEESIVLDSDSAKKIYLSEGWKLVKENLVLSYKDELKYTAARTIDMQMIMPAGQGLEDIQEDN